MSKLKITSCPSLGWLTVFPDRIINSVKDYEKYESEETIARAHIYTRTRIHVKRKCCAKKWWTRLNECGNIYDLETRYYCKLWNIYLFIYLLDGCIVFIDPYDQYKHKHWSVPDDIFLSYMLYIHLIIIAKGIMSQCYRTISKLIHLFFTFFSLITL